MQAGSASLFSKDSVRILLAYTELSNYSYCMPSKNVIKTYVPGGHYHIYTRGVEKRNIFVDHQDYGVFLSYLKTYLSPKDISGLEAKLAKLSTRWKDKDKILKLLRLNNFSEEITLLAYCLMPNHYHLLLKQEKEHSINYFMRSLNTRYVTYFNKKYDRVGPLYQDTYKAVLVESDEQLIHLSAYIHRNPLNSRPYFAQGVSLQRLTTQPSSLPEYLGSRGTNWLNSEKILIQISKTNRHEKYRKFILQSKQPSSVISELTID